MGLKLSLSKPDIDALPEPVRELYVERDGRFVLDTEVPVVPDTEVQSLKTRIADFRNNNIELTQKLSTLEPLAEKFKDVDPEEYRTLKAEKQKVTKKIGGKDTDDLESLIASTVQLSLKPVQEALKAEQDARAQAAAEAAQSKLRERLSQVATKYGVRSSGLRHVHRDGADIFEVRDGQVVAKAGQRHPTDPLKELTPEDWVQSLRKTDDYLFEPSTGGDANPAQRANGRQQAVKRLIDPTPEEKGRHMKEIASGQMVVEYTTPNQ